MTTLSQLPVPHTRTTSHGSQRHALLPVRGVKHHNPTACALAVAVLLGLAHTAYAQVGEPSPGSEDPMASTEVTRQPGRARNELERVTVTSRLSLSDRFFAPGSMVVVDRQDIEDMGAESVSDVMKNLPGLQVTTSGDGNLQIRMRGMDASGTQILVDGERSGGARSAQLPLDQLPADLIERIEVVRAPSAERSGASGGTINIVLRQPSVRAESNARLMLGHTKGGTGGGVFFSSTGPIPVGDAKPAVAVPGKALPSNMKPASPFTYFFAGSVGQRLWGSDISRSTTTATTPPTLTQSQGQYRSHSTEFFLSPRIQWKISAVDQLQLRLMANGAKGSPNYFSVGQGVDPTGATASSSQSIAQNQRGMVSARTDWTHRFKGSKLESYASLQNNFENNDRNGLQAFTNALSSLNVPSTYVDRRNENGATVSTKLSGTESQLLWMGGGEFEQRQMSVDNTATQGAAPANAYHLNAMTRRAVLWGQNEWEVWGKSTLSLGLRAENFQIRSDYNATTTGPATGTFDRLTWQPSAHLRVPLGKDDQLRFNLARIGRNPALMDLIDRRVPAQGINSPTNPDVAGNPNLKPESTVTFDTGWERKLGSAGMTGLNVFVRQLSDVITRPIVQDATGVWVQQAVNMGHARAWGVEADIKHTVDWPSQLGLGRGWNLSANGTVLQSRLLDGPAAGERIPGQARYVANLNLAKPMPRAAGWYGGFTLNLNGAADNNSSATARGRSSAYAGLDVNVGQLIPGVGYWRLMVQNLTNTQRVNLRNDVTNAGLAYVDQSTLLTGRRIFLALGTRF